MTKTQQFQHYYPIFMRYMGIFAVLCLLALCAILPAVPGTEVLSITTK